MKNYLSFLFLFGLLYSCGSDANEKQTNDLQPIKEKKSEKTHEIELKKDAVGSYFDSTELSEFWQTCIVPILNLDKSSIAKFVGFPLSGEWGSYSGIDKPRDQLTQNDFLNNIEKVFYQELLDSLQSMSFRDLLIEKDENGNKYIWVNFYFEHEYDGFVDEESIMLRFELIGGEWMLMGIFGAS